MRCVSSEENFFFLRLVQNFNEIFMAAFLLSINNYDVWMGNSRGNDHSLKHRNFSSQSKEFWNFSW